MGIVITVVLLLMNLVAGFVFTVFKEKTYGNIFVGWFNIFACVFLCLSLGIQVKERDTIQHFEKNEIITETKWEDDEKYYLIGDKWVDEYLKVKEEK